MSVHKMIHDESTFASILNSRMDNLNERLDRHITECTDAQRKLFWAVCSVLGWLVMKSLPFMSKIFS